jgi:hypothetical protein
MKTYGGVDAHIHVVLTLALVGCEWLASCPSIFTPGKEPQYPLDRRLSGPQTSLDAVEKKKLLTLPGLELQPLSRPARNQSLYRLRYLGSLYNFF